MKDSRVATLQSSKLLNQIGQNISLKYNQSCNIIRAKLPMLKSLNLSNKILYNNLQSQYNENDEKIKYKIDNLTSTYKEQVLQIQNMVKLFSANDLADLTTLETLKLKLNYFIA